MNYDWILRDAREKVGCNHLRNFDDLGRMRQDTLEKRLIAAREKIKPLSAVYIYCMWLMDQIKRIGAADRAQLVKKWCEFIDLRDYCSGEELLRVWRECTDRECLRRPSGFREQMQQERIGSVEDDVLRHFPGLEVRKRRSNSPEEDERSCYHPETHYSYSTRDIRDEPSPPEPTRHRDPAASEDDQAKHNTSLLAQTHVVTAASRAPLSGSSPAPKRGNYAAPLPRDYLCRRCGKDGHHIRDCPTNSDPSFDSRPGLDYRCHRCGRKGDHFIRNCPENPPFKHERRCQECDTQEYCGKSVAPLTNDTDRFPWDARPRLGADGVHVARRAMIEEEAGGYGSRRRPSEARATQDEPGICGGKETSRQQGDFFRPSKGSISHSSNHDGRLSPNEFYRGPRTPRESHHKHSSEPETPEALSKSGTGPCEGIEGVEHEARSSSQGVQLMSKDLGNSSPVTERPPIQYSFTLNNGIHSERQAMIDADGFLDAMSEDTRASPVEETPVVLRVENNSLSTERETKRRKIEHEFDYIEVDDDDNNDEKEKEVVGETANSTLDESAESPTVIDLCSAPSTPISDESHPAVEPYLPMKTVCAGRNYSFSVLKLFCNRENPWVNMPPARRTALDMWPEVESDMPRPQNHAEVNHMPWMFANAEEIVLSD